MMFENRPEFGIGAGLVFLPPIVCLIVFGRSLGMEAALQMGVNASFVILAVGGVLLLAFLAYKVLRMFFAPRE